MKPRSFEEDLSRAFPKAEAPQNLRERLDRYRHKRSFRPLLRGTLLAAGAAACLTLAILFVPARQAQAEDIQALESTNMAKTAIIEGFDDDGKLTGKLLYKEGRSLLVGPDGSYSMYSDGDSAVMSFTTLGLAIRYAEKKRYSPLSFLDRERFVNQPVGKLTHRVRTNSQGQTYDEYTRTQENHRSILSVSQATRTPFHYVRQTMFGGQWKTLNEQRIQLNVAIDDAAVKPAAITPTTIDLSIPSVKKWIHSLEAKPVGKYQYAYRDIKRDITFYDVAVTRQGDVFVLFTAKHYRSDFSTHLLKVTDNLGTRYACQDFFYPYPDWRLKGRPDEERKPFWVGGRQLCVRWFVPVNKQKTQLPTEVTIAVDPKCILNGMGGVIVTPSTKKLSQAELLKQYRKSILVGPATQTALRTKPTRYANHLIPPYLLFFDNNLWTNDDVTFLEWRAIAQHWQDRQNWQQQESALKHALDAINRAKVKLGTGSYPNQSSTMESYLACLKRQGKTREAELMEEHLEQTSPEYQSYINYKRHRR